MRWLSCQKKLIENIGNVEPADGGIRKEYINAIIRSHLHNLTQSHIGLSSIN